MITCFIHSTGINFSQQHVDKWLAESCVSAVFIPELPNGPEGVGILHSANPGTSRCMREIAGYASTGYILLCDFRREIEWDRYTLKRMTDIAEQTGCDWLYSDYRVECGGELHPYPTIDYQEGSLRDEFDFGPLILIRAQAFKEAVNSLTCEYQYAALYHLRLKISQQGELFHLNESLYTCKDTFGDVPDNAMFQYVNPANRERQIEMEQACTYYLKEINAWIPNDKLTKVDVGKGVFPHEASVIIPVRNRVNTVVQAVDSALSQITDFSYNVLVIDNHSTDGTTGLLAEKAAKDSRLIHYIPESRDLGIGGCWNEAVFHDQCGRFAIQLDSDDLYMGTDAIQKIVDCFYREQAAMVIGSYLMVDFNLTEIPPGIIDHREWTVENGRNNALRINGFGAPRAFYTPVIRDIAFPNVSYGEDYAVALRITRNYCTGRIYEPIYYCRRWEGNSDSSLSVSRSNAYNLYKDRIRTIELSARKQKADK
jgi:hypothetical protein